MMPTLVKCERTQPVLISVSTSLFIVDSGIVSVKLISSLCLVILPAIEVSLVIFKGSDRFLSSSKLSFDQAMSALQVSKQGSLNVPEATENGQFDSIYCTLNSKRACRSKAKCFACNHTICFALLGIGKLLSRSSVGRDLSGWTADGQMGNITC